MSSKMMARDKDDMKTMDKMKPMKNGMKPKKGK